MFAYMGRQPIFDRDKQIVGYELLYRDAYQAVAANVADNDAASRGVLSDAISVFGLSQLTNHLPAYINFTRNLILSDTALMADPAELVIEVMSSVNVDEALAEKLRALKKAGYKLALKDFSLHGKFRKITQLFDVVRVDFRRGNEKSFKQIVDWLGIDVHRKLLAERIESDYDFALARRLGFSLFQGYYFEKPVTLSKKRPPISSTSYGQLMNELLQSNANFDSCSKLITNDVLLSYLFMRQVQPSGFQRGGNGADIRHGMVLMGVDGLRRWASAVFLKRNNTTASDELPRRAYLRGLFIERLMEKSDFRSVDERQGFLMGVFSLMDQVTGQRLEAMLTELRMEEPIRQALLGQAENEYSLFLRYVILYEMENAKLILPDIRVSLSGEEISALYMRSTEDTDIAFYRMEGS